MPDAVLDASAMNALLRNESGAEAVEALLLDPDTLCFAHSVNLMEVYYDFLRQTDKATAQGFIEGLFAAGVVERNDLDRVFWEAVGEWKARGHISIADCFCIALAQRIGGEAVTADHREFDPLVSLGLCPIRFIR
jgi:PIN domain nuclease of toxin-antitoxin system